MQPFPITRLLIIVTLFINGPVAAVENPDPYVIVHKHLEAVGGLNELKAQKSIHLSGSIVFEGTGLQGTVEIWEKYPLQHRQEINLTIFQQMNGDNGKFSWAVDPNGKLTILKDGETLTSRKVKGLKQQYEHVNPESEFFILKYIGSENVGSKTCHVIKTINTINESVMTEYYDSDTFYLIKSIDKNPDREIHTLFSDFRTIEGFVIPFRYEQTMLPPGQKTIMSISMLDINPDIDPGIFEPPGI